MLKAFVRMGAFAASGATILVLTGCGGAAPTDWPAAPPPYAYEDNAPRPDLAGAPPAAQMDDSGLLGGPAHDASAIAVAPLPSHNLDVYRRADGTLVTAMKPIPNPEDLSSAERRRIYGPRYAPRAYTSSSPRSARRVAAAPAPIRAVRAEPVPAVAKPVAKAPASPAARAPGVPAARPAPLPGTRTPAPRAQADGEAKKGSSLPKFALPSFDMPKSDRPSADGLDGDGRSASDGFNLGMLAIPGMPRIDLPGVGSTPSQNVVLVGLAALLLLIAAMASRAAGERRRRADRRRKFRTMSSFAESEPEPEPESNHSHINPMLAAAGGAIAGAAAAHFAHSRDENQDAQAAEEARAEPEEAAHEGHVQAADQHEREPEPA